MSNHKTIWGIRAGQAGEAHALFMEKNVVAIGWPDMGDLSKIEGSRTAFKDALAKSHPSTKPAAVPNNAGQLYRFVHEMKRGDLIVYPSKADRQINIGEVTGDYLFDPALSASYPNIRSVKWLKSVGRVEFSQGALYEIGSAMSLFQVRNYSDEFRAVLEGKASPVKLSEDPTVELVQNNIEESTRDFIIKTLAQELKGHPFSNFVAHLLNTMGYRTRVSPEGADGGIDIIAHKDELGFEPPIIKVQVKSSEGSSISDPVVASLYGKVDPREFGLFVTLGTYTSAAKQFAKGKSNLRLIDGVELVNLILAHYEQFDSRYKGVLPLKRLYVSNRDDENEG